MAGTSGRRTGQGRKSPEARSVIAAGPGVQRPEPPDEFGKPERAVWHRIVDACPPDYFSPECLPLLARLCVLLVMSEELEAQWRAGTLEKRERSSYLEVTKQIGNITTKLRLTPQSRYNRFEASTRMKHRATYRPWETDEADDDRPKLLRVVPDE